VSVTAPLADVGLREPPPAPDRPPGWAVAPPDFVGVGMQRCGTTRWFDLIVSHPAVQAPHATRKELHYFDRFHDGGFTDAEARRYREYFPRPQGAITGEWTPLYASAPWVPPLLARSAPDARLLVLLRDPVERYRSAMARHARVAAARGEALNAMAPFDALARSLYHQAMLGLLRHFDRSRVLVLQYERCVADPRGELARTLAFLGLEPAPAGEEPDFDARPNEQPHKPELADDAVAAITDSLRDDVAALAEAFPEIDLRLWPRFASAGPTGPR
jgi:hypothetical protein